MLFSSNASQYAESQSCDMPAPDINSCTIEWWYYTSQDYISSNDNNFITFTDLSGNALDIVQHYENNLSLDGHVLKTTVNNQTHGGTTFYYQYNNIVTGSWVHYAYVLSNGHL